MAIAQVGTDRRQSAHNSQPSLRLEEEERDSVACPIKTWASPPLKYGLACGLLWSTEWAQPMVGQPRGPGIQRPGVSLLCLGACPAAIGVACTSPWGMGNHTWERPVAQPWPC